MAKIIFTAENFAFGPIGKLLNVANLLINSKHKLSFAGYGTSLQLAKRFPFRKIYKIDTDNPKSFNKLKSIISTSDVLISSMDIPSVTAAQSLGKLTIWLDCLFWFWDTIPDNILNVDLYIRERSMNDSKNKKKFAPLIKNFYTVGPIIGKINEAKRRPKALVSFGGGEAAYWYKVGRDSNYPFLMTKILLNNVNWDRFDQVLIATNEKIIRKLKQKFSQAPFKFACLSHKDFIQEMIESKIILISPGLVTSEIAFCSGTPTIFLPASNNSQYLQIEEFRRRHLAPASVQLSDFMPKLLLDKLPALKSMKAVLLQLRQFEKSPNIQLQVGNKLNQLINDQSSWEKKFIVNGKKFIKKQGGNGAQAAAKKINQLILSAREKREQ
jgi:hypothetical protein